MTRTRLLLDAETIPRPDAQEYLKARKNLKDPEKIAADLAEKAGMAAVDPDLALPVCIGLWMPDEDAPKVWWTDHVRIVNGGPLPLYTPEADILAMFWETLLSQQEWMIGGFNLDFDVSLLLRRSQLVGVKSVHVDTNRYRPHRCDDLMHRLTFKGTLVPKSLSTYGKLFGIPNTNDDLTGADVPAAIAAGDFDRVENHCLSDLTLTARLFERLEADSSGRGLRWLTARHDSMQVMR